jgi:Protein of unknown function (DUF1552)
MAFRLNRRAVLRGAGSVAIALPWLEAMLPEGHAQAAAPPARRFVGVYTPGGTVLDFWQPGGSEHDFVLSPILAPLASVREHVTLLSGIDMTCAVGEQNQAGLIGLWTGSQQATTSGRFATGPSIDQVLAPRLSAGQRLASLELAVRWGTGKAHGQATPFSIASYADTAAWDPVAPRLDPAQIWASLFGSSDAAWPDAAWDRSILDSVSARYARLAQRVGSGDRQVLEAHLTRIRELELNVAAAARCKPVTLVDTSDYDPAAGLRADDSGSIVDAETDAAIPKVGTLMMDMLVMALACDLTSVATLMWSDTEAKHTFPWLGLNEHLHFYMNDGGFRPQELTQIFTWYTRQHAYLIEKLAQTRSARGSLLDETVVFFGSHLQHPATHDKTDMPFFLAGRGGGLRTNRWVSYDQRSHNDLLLELLNLCGDQRQTFGAPQYCTGPLGGLT